MDVAAVLSVPKTRAVTGLTGCTILVATDETEAYFPANRRVCRQMPARWRGRRTPVQSLVDTEWRLMRSYPTFSEALPPRQLWNASAGFRSNESVLAPAFNLPAHSKQP
jgi:hypothetical protein